VTPPIANHFFSTSNLQSATHDRRCQKPRLNQVVLVQSRDPYRLHLFHCVEYTQPFHSNGGDNMQIGSPETVHFGNGSVNTSDNLFLVRRVLN